MRPKLTKPDADNYQTGMACTPPPYMQEPGARNVILSPTENINPSPSRYYTIYTSTYIMQGGYTYLLHTVVLKSLHPLGS